MPMKRRDILETTELILSLLDQQGELPIKRIAEEVDVQWRTALKSLEFLKRIDVVKEREGKKSYHKERLFSLNFEDGQI